MMFLLCAILWAWCGHGSIALQDKKRTGAGVRKEGLYYAGKGESRNSAGGSLPLHDSSGYKGNREWERTGTKSCCVSDFLAFFTKNFLYHLSSNTSFIPLIIVSDFLAFLQKNFLHIHVYSQYIKSIFLNTFS